MLWEIGKINISGDVYASDPCYDIECWCGDSITKVKPGVYKCYVDEKYTGKMWGDRFLSLTICHTDYVDETIQQTIANQEFYEIEIPVDGGTAGLFDYEYYEKVSTDKQWWSEKVHSFVREPGFNICDERGVWCCSGYGDGRYPIYVDRNEDFEVIKISIIFINDNDTFDKPIDY